MWQSVLKKFMMLWTIQYGRWGRKRLDYPALFPTTARWRRGRNGPHQAIRYQWVGRQEASCDGI